MDGPLSIPVDEAVRMWLAEDLAQHERSGSVRKLEPRVLVRDGSSVVARRPFRRKGAYCVRWAGTARLISASRVDGLIIFDVSWA
ncbi:hypothetical protein HFN89_00385 [Rhizobium laguerreae]|nr:hypothetical protein [Rhizobium laguerreae]